MARRALGDASPFIFPADSASGHLMECQFALNQVAECCAVRVSPHDLRRTYATMAAPLISGFALKALLNHALGSADVTSGYVQFTAENLREPAQAVADKLMQLCGVEPVAGENVTTLRWWTEQWEGIFRWFTFWLPSTGDNWYELVDDEKFEQVLYGPIAVCSSVEAAKAEAQRIYDEEVDAVEGEKAALVWTDLAPEGTLQASGDEVGIVFQINPAKVVS